MHPMHQGVPRGGGGGGGEKVLGRPSRPLPLPLRKLIFFTSGGEVSVKLINLGIKNVTLNKSQRENRHDRSVGNLGVMQSPPPPLYKI